jgi:hypothetical protein
VPALLLVLVYCTLWLPDWALTFWALATGWLHLGGTAGWRKGNPLAAGVLFHDTCEAASPNTTPIAQVK